MLRLLTRFACCGSKRLNKNVKAAVKNLKRKRFEKVVSRLEEDFQYNNSKNLFKTVKELEGRPGKALTMVKDKHFKIHLNTSSHMTLMLVHLLLKQTKIHQIYG